MAPGDCSQAAQLEGKLKRTKLKETPVCPSSPVCGSQYSLHPGTSLGCFKDIDAKVLYPRNPYLIGPER